MTVEDDVVLGLVPHVHRAGSEGDTELWTNGTGSWSLSHAEALVAKQFSIPSEVGLVVRAIGETQREAVRGIVASLADRGLLQPPTFLSAGDQNAIGLFRTPVNRWEDAVRSRPDVAVVGMPYDVGVTYRPGARFGPELLRRAAPAVFTYREVEGVPVGMHDVTSGLRVLEGVRMVDLGNLRRVVMTRNGDAFDDLESLVGAVAQAGTLPLVIGGDHSVALPAVRGVASNHPGVVVVHIDAHHDFGTARTDDYRNRMHHGNFLDWVVGDERVARTVQVGLRQLTDEPPENHPNLVRFPDRTALEGAGFDGILAAIPEGSPVHLSIDVDVLDPAILPGTGTRLPRGWSASDLVGTVERIARERRVVGIDVCELAGEDDMSGLVVADLILRLLDAVFRRKK